MTVTKTLILGRDTSNFLNNAYCEFPMSTDCRLQALAADVVQSYVVPPNIDCVLIDYSKAQVADVYVSINMIPTPPGDPGVVLTEDGGDVLTEDGGNVLLEGSGSAGSGFRINPLLISVSPGDIIYLLASDNTVVGISFYSRNLLKQF